MTIDVPAELPPPSLPPGRTTPLDRGGGSRRVRRVMAQVTPGMPAAGTGMLTTTALASAPHGSV